MRTELTQATDRLKMVIAMVGEYDYVLGDLLDVVGQVLHELQATPRDVTIGEFLDHTDVVGELSGALEQVKGFRYFDPDSAGQLPLFGE
jgi:hypothetical protein